MTNPFREDMSRWRNRVEGYIERKVVESADVVVTNTQALKDEFIERFPREPLSKFVALLNGFDPEDGQVASDRRAIRKNSLSRIPDFSMASATPGCFSRRSPR